MSLQVQSLSKAFGGLKAVNDISFSTEPESVTSVIGPNGAGKTTLFNVITGSLRADSGKVLFNGEDITNLSPHEIVRKGIVRSFQIVNIFPKLTVFENVQVALVSWMGKSPNFFSSVHNIGRPEVLDILDTVGLSEQAEYLAGTLSYGDQRIMEIAIALASRPALLLLDEPTAGMGPQETRSTIELIRRLSDTQGLTIILIEHDMDVVFSVSDAIVVTHQGEVIAEGRPEEVRDNEKVRSVYLGDTTRKPEHEKKRRVSTSVEVRDSEPSMEPKPILEVGDLHTFYGLSHVLFGMSITVRERELVSLLGRNGAGKTTTLKSIMGLTPPRSGTVVFQGQNLANMRPHEVFRQGVCYVPADRRVYRDLSVRENLEVGQWVKGKRSLWTVKRIYELFPHLEALDSRLAGYLSGGERQMLTIARALMGDPELLLLDEPTEGLAPMIVAMLEEQILKLKQEGTSILLAEQNIQSALRISDYGFIINKGTVVYKGTVEELKGSEKAMKHLTL
jgi:branched-chain amino acid transport system ATP-binding protein